MKTIMLFVLLVFATGSQALPALTEPLMILHGAATDGATQQPVTITSIIWQVTDGTESGTFTVASAPPTRIVQQSGQSFYILEVPFETRVIKTPTGQTVALTRRGQSFELKSPEPTYTLTPFINGRAATIRTVDGTPSGGPALTIPNDPATNGKLIRVDLTLPPPTTYEQWAADNFPNPAAPEAAPTADPDGDDANNEQEYQAGTDPNNRASVLSIISSTLQPNGTISATFQTVPGRRYRLMNSTDLGAFAQDGQMFTATDAQTRIVVPLTDHKKFYRLESVTALQQ